SSLHSATTALSPLSLHDALPIWLPARLLRLLFVVETREVRHRLPICVGRDGADVDVGRTRVELAFEEQLELARARVALEEQAARSEEHTSELQSRFDLVCRLLLE